MSNEQEYFASLPSDELAEELGQRVTKYGTNRDAYERRWRRNYRFFYNQYHNDFSGDYLDTAIRYGGEQDEYTLITANHFKNILQHWQTLITGIKPSFQPRAINADHKSLSQAKLASDLIDYYVKEKKFYKHARKAVLDSLIMDAGYIRVEWDVDAGREYAVGNNSDVIHEGDIRISTISPFDIVMDMFKPDFEDNDWVIVRSFKSKWDLINRYIGDPDEEGITEEESAQRREQRDKVLGATDAADVQLRSRPFESETMEADDVQVFEFLHKKTRTMPNGRYMMYSCNDIVYYDGDLPYRDIQVYQVTAGDDIASPFGYSIANDLANLQEMHNAEVSAIATNHDQFAVQSVVAPRDANVKAHKVTENMSLLEYDPVPGAPNGGEPRGLNLTATPPEVFTFLREIQQNMETVSGINSVIRGQPDPSLRSGTALALVQNQALAFASHLQDAYVQMLEDVATSIVRTLRDFAQTTRIITIAGKYNRSAVKEFSGDDLENIDRVTVDLSNPLANTTAGRVEIANNLINTGLIKTPEEYITVVETGQMNPLTEHNWSELQNIHAENERLMIGEVPPAIITDDHKLHILEHKILLDDPEIRLNGAFVQQILGHIQEHIKIMADPNMPAQMLHKTLGHAAFGDPTGGQGQEKNPVGRPPSPKTEVPNAIQPQGVAVRSPTPPREPTVPPPR